MTEHLSSARRWQQIKGKAPRIVFFWAGSLADSYQTQREVEQRRAAVEQHGEEGGGGGEEEANVPAHHHPQRLKDLQNNNNNNNKQKVNADIQREPGFPKSLC